MLTRVVIGKVREWRQLLRSEVGITSRGHVAFEELRMWFLTS
jgi:hypothetical protein